MNKAVVLLSGGQDSTTCLFWARERFEVHAVAIWYGQRHAVEIESADRIAALAGATFMVLRQPVLADLGDSALVRSAQAIQGDGGREDAKAPNGLPTSFVPGRNLFFLATAAAYAAKIGARDIVTGVCQTDYSGYPDCRREFIDATEKAITLAMPSSAGPFTIHTPLMALTKAATVHLARSLPGCWDALAYSVTCYEGKLPGCGKCPACDLRGKGFAQAGYPDPAA
jgi:7-cyano-7-deazaguanine synthase